MDTQWADSAALAALKPDDIANLYVVKGAAARTLNAAAAGRGLIVITTKANANSPDVLAFNNRINSKLPLVTATAEQEAGMAAAKAYIAQHYPNAKLEEVGLFTQTKQPARYLATFMEGGKRVQLLFDGNGQPVDM